VASYNRISFKFQKIIDKVIAEHNNVSHSIYTVYKEHVRNSPAGRFDPGLEMSWPYLSGFLDGYIPQELELHQAIEEKVYDGI
jgi:hypothetical protein